MELAAQNNLIQKKIILSFALIGAALVAGSFLILQFSINSTFRTMEAEQSAKDLLDVESAIEQQISALETFNRDFASWDDTYEALANRALIPEYARSNLSTEQWPDNVVVIDGMMMLDTQGAFVAGKLFDPISDEELSIEKIVLKELASNYPAFTTNIPEQDKTTEVSAFIETSEGLLLIVSGPITKSNYEGEPRGRFLTLHFLNTQRLETIGHRARVQLRLLQQPSLETEASEKHSDGSFVLKHHPIKDLLGTTLAIVEVGTPKDISQVGARSINSALLFLSLAIIAGIILAWQALRQLMVQPLLSLKKHVAEMRETENLASRYSARAQDEVGTLAEEINVLAARLDTSQTSLTSALEEAESSSRVKSEFLATMSHEIRTPLNGVIGMTDLLQHTGLTEKQQHLAETVMSSAEVLLKLIDDILDFTKISSGKKTVTNTQFSLEELLKEVSDAASEAAKSNGLNYRVSVDKDLANELVADSEALKSVLHKLLDNAVKFTKSGEVVLTVDRRDANEADDNNSLIVGFCVRDTGVGIRQEDLGNVFELFSQVDSSLTREYGGTGLGLSLSKDLVKMMGGEITVSSTIDEGSEFLITIPATYPASSR